MISIWNSFIDPIKEIFKTKIIIGEPISGEDVMVVPVSKVRIQGGAGGKENEKEGGGGLNASARPVGFIKLFQGKAKFIPVFDLITFFNQIIGILAMIFLFVLWIIKINRKTEQTKIMQQLIKWNKKKNL